MITFNLFGYKVTIESSTGKGRAKELLELANLNYYSNTPKIALIKALREKEPEKYGSNVAGGLGLKLAKEEIERLFDFTYDTPRIISPLESYRTRAYCHRLAYSFRGKIRS